MPASERPGPVTGDPAFYSSRAVLADAAGLTEVFGPVHSERGLRKLIEDLGAAGWHVQRHVKLTSVARFKEHPPAWQAIARQAAQ
jgi:hypothetical protein